MDDKYITMSLRAWSNVMAVIGSLVGLGVGWLIWG